MTNFVQFTEDTGMGKQAVLVNVDQIAVARIDKETGRLILIMAGNDKEFAVAGDEAKAVLAVLKNE